jgi:hypothetical protein
MSEPQTCTTGICGMERCTGACPVSGWITGFFPVEWSEMDSLRDKMRIKIGSLWLDIHRMSQDKDLTLEFREALANSARLLHQADQALSVPLVMPFAPSNQPTEVPTDAGF